MAPNIQRTVFADSAVVKKKEKADPFLVDAFCLTPEFLAVDLLFKRASIPIEKSEVILILLEGNWDTLFSFHPEHKGRHAGSFRS